MSVSSLQKHIYNCYLSSLAKAQKRPFRFREDFDGMEQGKLAALERLESFFVAHPHMNVALFMDAPYKVYTDKDRYALDFYLKPMAFKTYFMYLNFLDMQNPDHPENLNIIKEGIIFIKNFCLEQKIPLMSYLSHTEAVTYSWCQHLLSQKISIYNLLAFSHFGINIYMLISRMPTDERELFLSQYNDNITEYMKKLNNSEKAKILLVNGYKKIEKIIDGGLK